MKNETEKALQEALEKIQKKYGAGAVMTSEDIPDKVEAVPTGCYAIDTLLGCGGLPRGRVIEVYGQESSGKSTLCLFFAAQIQKAGGTVVYIDAENAYDRNYANGIGVDTDKLLVSQPETLEETMDIVRTYCESNSVDLIVVDSVASLVPKSELEGDEMLKDTMAVQARLMSKALRILSGPVSRSKTIVIFINQLRDKIGVFYGEKTVSPGGKALKFYASVRIAVSKGEKLLGPKEAVIGNTVKLTAVKNKVGFPFRTGTFDLYYGSGVDLVGDALTYGESIGVIGKSGNTYTFEQTKLGVGYEVARAYLIKNNDVFLSIKQKIDEYNKTKGSTR